MGLIPGQVLPKTVKEICIASLPGAIKGWYWAVRSPSNSWAQHHSGQLLFMGDDGLNIGDKFDNLLEFTYSWIVE